MKEVIILKTRRSHYSVDECADETMTVQELIDILSDYEPDTKICYSNDNNYTYGYIGMYDIKTREIEDDEDEDEDEE